MPAKQYIVYIAEFELYWEGAVWAITFTRNYDHSTNLSVEDFLADACAKNVVKTMNIPYKRALKNLKLLSFNQREGEWKSDSLPPMQARRTA